MSKRYHLRLPHLNNVILIVSITGHRGIDTEYELLGIISLTLMFKNEQSNTSTQRLVLLHSMEFLQLIYSLAAVMVKIVIGI